MDEIIDALMAFWPSNKREGVKLYDEVCLNAKYWLNGVTYTLFEWINDEAELNKRIFDNKIIVRWDSVDCEFSNWQTYKFLVGKGSMQIVTEFKYGYPGELRKLTVVQYGYGKLEGHLTGKDLFDKRFVVDCKEYTFN